MLKIKLLPTGKKNTRLYRIIVAEDRSKLSGKVVEYLGTFNPHSASDQVKIDRNLYQSWLEKGARPTETVKSLVAKTK